MARVKDLIDNLSGQHLAGIFTELFPELTPINHFRW